MDIHKFSSFIKRTSDFEVTNRFVFLKAMVMYFDNVYFTHQFSSFDRLISDFAAEFKGKTKLMFELSAVYSLRDDIQGELQAALNVTSFNEIIEMQALKGSEWQLLTHSFDYWVQESVKKDSQRTIIHFDAEWMTVISKCISLDFYETLFTSLASHGMSVEVMSKDEKLTFIGHFDSFGVTAKKFWTLWVARITSNFLEVVIRDLDNAINNTVQIYQIDGLVVMDQIFDNFAFKKFQSSALATQIISALCETTREGVQRIFKSESKSSFQMLNYNLDQKYGLKRELDLEWLSRLKKIRNLNKFKDFSARIKIEYAHF